MANIVQDALNRARSGGATIKTTAPIAPSSSGSIVQNALNKARGALTPQPASAIKKTVQYQEGPHFKLLDAIKEIPSAVRYVAARVGEVEVGLGKEMYKVFDNIVQSGHAVVAAGATALGSVAGSFIGDKSLYQVYKRQGQSPSQAFMNTMASAGDQVRTSLINAYTDPEKNYQPISDALGESFRSEKNPLFKWMSVGGLAAMKGSELLANVEYAPGVVESFLLPKVTRVGEAMFYPQPQGLTGETMKLGGKELAMPAGAKVNTPIRMVISESEYVRLTPLPNGTIEAVGYRVEPTALNKFLGMFQGDPKTLTIEGAPKVPTSDIPTTKADLVPNLEASTTNLGKEYMEFPIEQLYKPNGDFTPQMASGRISDTAGKLDKFFPGQGLGKKLLNSVDVNAISPYELLQQAIKLADTGMLGGTTPAAMAGIETLHAELIPGLAKTIVEDVIPKTKSAVQYAKDVWHELKSYFNPVSSAPKQAVDVIMEQKGKVEEYMFRIEQSMKEVEKMWDKQPTNAIDQFLEAVETGGEVQKGFENIAKLYRLRSDINFKIITQYKDINYWENYFPHYFKNPKAVKEFLQTRRRLEGSNRPFLKSRVFEDYMTAKKFGFEPVSTNPETLMQMAEFDVRRFQMAQEIVKGELSNGTMAFVASDGIPPKGFMRIDDLISRTYFNKKSGFDVLYAQPDLAKIIHNMLSRDLVRESKIGTGLMNARNFFNAMQLGLSAFHFTFETIDAMTSQLQIAGSYLFSGDVTKFLKKLAQVPAAPIRYFTRGRKAYLSANFRDNIPGHYVDDPVINQFINENLTGSEEERVQKIAERRKSQAEKNIALMRKSGFDYEDIINEDGSLTLYLKTTADQAKEIEQAKEIQTNTVFASSRDEASMMTSMDTEKMSIIEAKLDPADILFDTNTFEFETIRTVSLDKSGIYRAKSPVELGAPSGAYRPPLSKEDATLTSYFTGGGSLRQRQYFRSTVWETFKKNVREGNYISAIVRMPFAVVEASVRPVLDYYVPRLKVGAFEDLLAQEMVRRDPEITAGQVTKTEIMRNVMNSIENRMGEMNYDSLFWNRTFKAAMQMAFRSPTWNIGTIREIGGAIFQDVPRGVYHVLKFGKGNIAQRIREAYTQKIGYTFALFFLTAVIGGVYEYLHTGKGPAELKDFFFPHNGATDANGHPVRITLPTYIKDALAWSKSPLTTIGHKFAGEFSLLIALLSNKDYFGDYIRDTQADMPTQFMQVGQYLIEEVMPFSVQQQQKLMEGTASLEQQIESFFGIVKAPAAIQQEEWQKLLAELYTKAQGEQGPRTPEQKEIDNLKKQARAEIKMGKTDTLNQLIKMGVIKTKAALNTFVRNAQMTGEERMFEGLSKEDKQKVLDLKEGGASSESSLIDTVLLYAQAIGTDPVTAFNRIFTGQKITKLKNGTIIVERMPLYKSQEVKAEQAVKAGASMTDVKLEHVVSLELGGSNAKSNLRLVSNAEWNKFTEMDNYLGDLLAEGRISKKEAQQLIKDFKDGKITADEIRAKTQ